MKKLLTILLLQFCLTGLNTIWADGYHYRFLVVDTAFDQIAAQMDSIDNRQHLDESSLPQLHALDSIARLRPTPQLEARLDYLGREVPSVLHA